MPACSPSLGPMRLLLVDDWNRDSHPMKKNDFGVFEIVLPPNENGQVAIPHNSKIKVCGIAFAVVPSMLTMLG